MMPEISLNILDVAENSTRAKASLVTIIVDVQTSADTLTVVIEDDGCGMSQEQLSAVTDPFFTTRTTRKVGLGVPFFKQAAESTDGSFSITSTLGAGTRVCAVFTLSHIDRMPLGDINGTIHTLVTMHPECDFLYTFRFNEKEFSLDTREFREILGDISFQEPEVSLYIKDYLKENYDETNNNAYKL